MATEDQTQPNNSTSEVTVETTVPAPPPVFSPTPPLLPAQPARKSSSARSLLATLLSICLGLFLVDAVVSLLDDTLILAFGNHLFAGIRATLSLFVVLIAFAVYVLMAFVPMIPKRLMLPVTLFNPLALLATIPLIIYCYNHRQLAATGISLCQVAVGFGVLGWAQGGLKFGWPLVAENSLTGRGFSWGHLLGFVSVNFFVLLPLSAIYLVACASLGVNQASEGFVSLRPGGIVVQERTYVRNDGKSIELVPMAHIGDASFYRTLTESFPTNATILMEGVTDKHNLLTNRITYKRTATKLGLSEQQQEFRPSKASIIHADVDVSVFTTNTIHFLNLIMLIQAKGLTPATVLPLFEYKAPQNFEAELLNDLLHKRNHHLLEAIESELTGSQVLVVPWGAAHMPEIAQEIQNLGFHLAATENRTVIHFRFLGNQSNATEQTEADHKRD